MRRSRHDAWTALLGRAEALARARLEVADDDPLRIDIDHELDLLTSDRRGIAAMDPESQPLTLRYHRDVVAALELRIDMAIDARDDDE